MLQLDCPQCRAAIPSEDINISADVAKCAACNMVFRPSEALAMSTFNNEHKRNLLLPNGVTVTPGLQLDIALAWRKLGSNWIYWVFGFAFTGVPLVIGVVVLITPDTPWFIIPFLGIFLAVGVSFLFAAIARLINTTYITASAHELRVESSPISVLGWKTHAYKRSEVTQFFVTQYEESRTNNRPNYAYALRLLLKNGTEVELVKGLRNAATAFYIEYQLEKYLSIDDKPMPGEFVPGQRVGPQSFREVIQLAKSFLGR